MKYLKLFEDYEEEIVELFNPIVIDAKVSSFKHNRYDRINIYVLYGSRIEFDDHLLLKELYDYRTICREVYNKEYFHIIMTESKVVMILFDYKNTSTTSSGYVDVDKNDWRIKDIRTHLFSNKVPGDIYSLIAKEESTWKGYGCIQSGIKYTNGNGGNLALYDWQYGHGSTYNRKQYTKESREVDISIEREKEIYNIIDDCLLDITDNDNNFHISRALSDDYEIVNSNKALLGMELQVTLYNNNPFQLNDIVEPLNNLISQLSGEGIELKSITYRYNDIAKTKHDGWYRMSMDPIDNKIKGNTILSSDLDKLRVFKLTFN